MHRQSQLATPLSPRPKGSNTEALARVPTFSTGEIKLCMYMYAFMNSTVFDFAAGVSHIDNHRAPIVSITPITSTGTSSSATASGDGGGTGLREGGSDIQEASSGLSFQLATLDGQAATYM